MVSRKRARVFWAESEMLTMRVDLWSRELLFGQYRGRSVEDVPFSYLLWVLRSVEDLEPEERRVLQAEVLDRQARGAGGYERRQYQAPPTKLPAGVTVEILLEVARLARRAAAKTFHPDTGGDPERMRAINCACDYLETEARALSAGGRASA
jgi:hypothetical protein